MPVVSVVRDHLFKALGRPYTDEEFEELCFDYGIELDDVTTEREMIRKELNNADTVDESASEDVLYKIDIPANRYDMLCIEGISRALNIFQGRIEAPAYKVADMTGKSPVQMTVKPQTALIRPFIVCAVLRGVKFDAARYNSFIELQDKLHQNLCRQRSLVAIGTHDLAKLQPPFTYEALLPEDIVFTPLKQTRDFQAKELMEHYLANDAKLKKYVPLIKDSLVYPVLFDANRTVLSLPPIINGAASAISLATRDVFVECTATDHTKACIVLNTVVCMFSQYTSQPFVVEPVEVRDAFGEARVYPDLSYREMNVSVEYVNSMLGLKLSASQMATLVRRMGLEASEAPGAAELALRVPPTRSDILHPVDVVEDVAIAFGYNNIPKRIPPVVVQGREFALNALTELLRIECAAAGFTEVLTWALLSRSENFELLRQPLDSPAVTIGNPATAEFEVCRTSLLASVLKTLGANKDSSLPIKLFEVSDTVVVDAARDVGARNVRRLLSVYCGKESGFEVVHGLLNRVMEALGVPCQGSDEVLEARFGGSYSWTPSQRPFLFSGRQADVIAKGVTVGYFGIVHPEVLENFDIPYAVSVLELDIEPFVFDQFFRPLLRPQGDVAASVLPAETEDAMES